MNTRRSQKSEDEQFELYEKAMSGNIEALMDCSLEMGLINEKQYSEFIEMGMDDVGKDGLFT